MAKLINSVAEVINNDSDVKGRLEEGFFKTQENVTNFYLTASLFPNTMGSKVWGG
jgi:hypothetical protein